MSVKQCRECKKTGVGPKPHSEFCKNRTQADGLQDLCKEHSRAANRENFRKKGAAYNREKGKRFRTNNPVGYRRLSIRAGLSRYGLSEAQYASMFERQAGLCAVCKTKMVSQLDGGRERKGHAPNEVARVDHCHATGHVRGLLCFGCNVGLGKFKDDEKVLFEAIRYLRLNATGSALDRTQNVNLQGEKEPLQRDLDRAKSRVSRRDDLSPFMN